jgi:hypothetical protein
LARRQAGVRWIVLEVFHVRNLPEHAHAAVSAHESHRAYLDADAVPICVQDHDFGIHLRRSTDEIAHEVLSCPT